MLCSTVTDWIQAIAQALAVPGAIVSFIILFRKDKDKQSQIDRLTNIASKLEVQNEILKRSNDLQTEQIDVLRNSTILTKQDNEGANRLVALEEKKIKLSVKPYFKRQSIGWDSQIMDFKFVNYGERATITSIINLNKTELHFEDAKLPVTVEKGQLFILHLNRYNYNINPNQLEYKFEILYKDGLDNFYKQVLSGTGQRSELTEPEEV